MNIPEILKRLGELGINLCDISKLNPEEIPNFNAELKCALGALIKSLEIQLEKINS